MRSPAKRFYLLISNDFPLRNLMSAAQVPDSFVPLAATVVFASGCSASAAVRHRACKPAPSYAV
jgi:hypothetical protein